MQPDGPRGHCPHWGTGIAPKHEGRRKRGARQVRACWASKPSEEPRQTGCSQELLPALPPPGTGSHARPEGHPHSSTCGRVTAGDPRVSRTLGQHHSTHWEALSLRDVGAEADPALVGSGAGGSLMAHPALEPLPLVTVPKAERRRRRKHGIPAGISQLFPAQPVTHALGGTGGLPAPERFKFLLEDANSSSGRCVELLMELLREVGAHWEHISLVS